MQASTAVELASHVQRRFFFNLKTARRVDPLLNWEKNSITKTWIWIWVEFTSVELRWVNVCRIQVLNVLGCCFCCLYGRWSPLLLIVCLSFFIGVGFLKKEEKKKKKRQKGHFFVSCSCFLLLTLYLLICSYSGVGGKVSLCFLREDVCIAGISVCFSEKKKKKKKNWFCLLGKTWVLGLFIPSTALCYKGKSKYWSRMKQSPLL